ncbi:hypothetical protein N782_16505 [Pontibacillus yanchengensis Y32]|uniref:Uncharacterized protein n=2 Tax=Pontibacillus yanchengensis TaxID=462910 RepID=A0A0A2TQW8_9BACI|nr:hypothetical protein N782_16505 [Pontibacillus yanchengensis Y32]
MRPPRIRRSLFSLALIIFVIGLMFQEDFWTKAPGEKEKEETEPVVEEEITPKVQHSKDYNHNNPKVSPLEIEDAPVDINEEIAETDHVSLLLIEDQQDENAKLTFVTMQPKTNTLYVSKINTYQAVAETTEVLEQLEKSMKYPLDYYIRLDQEAIQSISDRALENEYFKELVADQLNEANVVNAEIPEVNIGTMLKDMSQLSFSTLLSLNQLATDVQKEIETNLSVGELVVLRNKIGMDTLTKPMNVEEGFYFESLPASNELSDEQQNEIASVTGV